MGLELTVQFIQFQSEFLYTGSRGVQQIGTIAERQLYVIDSVLNNSHLRILLGTVLE